MRYTRLWPLPHFWRSRATVLMDVQQKDCEEPCFHVSTGGESHWVTPLGIVRDLKLHGLDVEEFRPVIEERVAVAIIKSLGLESLVKSITQHIFEESEKRTWPKK